MRLRVRLLGLGGPSFAALVKGSGQAYGRAAVSSQLRRASTPVIAFGSPERPPRRQPTQTGDEVSGPETTTDMRGRQP